MTALLVVAAGALIVIGVVLVLFRGKEQADPKWDSYLLESESGLQRILGPVAKEFSGTKAVRRLKGDQVDGLREKLRVGNAFFGDEEVFFSYQAAAILLAIMAASISFLPNMPTLFRVVFLLLGAILIVWPYNTVRQEANKRTRAILRELPDFAELLLMVLPSMSVPQSLTFTSSRLQGPVSFEMRELVKSLSNRTMGEDEAFDLTAERLGTVEAKQFVASLKTAYIDGNKSVEVIRAQVDNLRKIQYQDARAKAKRLPITIIVAFALHFMPLIFIVVFIPVAAALGGV